MEPIPLFEREISNSQLGVLLRSSSLLPTSSIVEFSAPEDTYTMMLPEEHANMSKYAYTSTILGYRAFPQFSHSLDNCNTVSIGEPAFGLYPLIFAKFPSVYSITNSEVEYSQVAKRLNTIWGNIANKRKIQDVIAMYPETIALLTREAKRFINDLRIALIRESVDDYMHYMDSAQFFLLAVEDIYGEGFVNG